MGGSKGGSVGSYSSGSADNVGNVLDKYGANETGGKIAKVKFTADPIQSYPYTTILSCSTHICTYVNI